MIIDCLHGSHFKCIYNVHTDQSTSGHMLWNSMLWNSIPELIYLYCAGA